MIRSIVRVWFIAAIASLVISCGSDSFDDSSSTVASPKDPSGPSAALAKSCRDHGGVWDFEGREDDGSTEDWVVVCRDRSVEVIDVY